MLAGYLVEHFRTGAGTQLQLHLRLRPFDSRTAPQANKVAAANAGVMVVTRHSLPQAEAFWDGELVPGLRKFAQVVRMLCQDPDHLRAFLAAPDKRAWYDRHQVLIRGMNMP